MTLDYKDLKKIKQKQQLDYILGLDLGIGSVGWAMALIDADGNPYKIFKMNSLIFSSGMVSGGNDSAVAVRRANRHVRRNKRRKNYRKQRLINYFIQNKMLSSTEVTNALKDSALLDVYKLRTKALDEQLTMAELFKVCYFFYNHRGFRSLRKVDSKLSAKDLNKLEDTAGGTTKDSEDTKLLFGVETQRKLAENYRTIGEMLYKDSKFKDAKRNHAGSYLNSVGRKELQHELNVIFNKQSEYNDLNDLADFVCAGVWNQRDFDDGPTVDLKSAGNHYTYKNGDLVERMIGKDPYKTSELRAPKGSYASALHRLWQKINDLAYTFDPEGTPEKLTNDERHAVYAYVMHGTKDKVRGTVNYTQLAKQVFGLKLKKGEDIAKKIWFNLTDNAKDKFFDANGLDKLQDVVQPEQLHNQDLLNSLAMILLAHKSDKTRLDALNKLFKTTPEYKVMVISDDNYAQFLALNMTQTDTFGLHTLDIINTAMAGDEDYSYSTVMQNYFSKQLPRMSFKDFSSQITNPVVNKTLTRVSRLIETIIKEYGFPASIHLEFTKDFARNKTDKNAINKNQKVNRDNNIKAKKALVELSGLDEKAIAGFDIVKYKLWVEQQGIDLYTGKPIRQEDIIGNATEVDHIVPYSWSFNDSYNNKVLTMAQNNQNKGQHTPLDWMNASQGDTFKAMVASTHLNPAKTRNLLKLEKDVDRTNIGWKNSALSNTGYIATTLLRYLQDNFMVKDDILLHDADGKKSSDLIVAFNGATTSTWRTRWGIAKVRENGHLHHAVDAAAIAMITRKMADRVAKQAKKHELGDLHGEFALPYRDFRREINALTSSDPKKMMSGHTWDHYTFIDIDKLKTLVVVHKDHHKLQSDMVKSTIYGALDDKDDDTNTILTSHQKATELFVWKDKIYTDKELKNDKTLLNSNLRKQLIDAYELAGEQYIQDNPVGSKHALLEKDDSYIYAGDLLFNDGYVPTKTGKVKRVLVKKADYRESSYFDSCGGYQSKNAVGNVAIYKASDGKYKLSATYSVDAKKNKMSNTYFNGASDPMHAITSDDKHVLDMHNGDYLLVTLTKDKAWKPVIGSTDAEIKLFANEPILAQLASIDTTSGRLILITPNGGYKELKVSTGILTSIKKVSIDYLGNLN